MSPRSFTEHTMLVSRFAAQVEALSPAAWQRLMAHCRPLAGTTPAALFARAALFAAPMITPDVRAAPALIRAIPLATKAFGVTIGLTYEMVTSAFPSTLEPPWSRRTTTGREDFDRRIDAHNAIEHAMERQGMRIPSVATALRAAARAVEQHDWLAPGTFERVYQWVEPVLPYAQVDSATAAVDAAAV